MNTTKPIYRTVRGHTCVAVHCEETGSTLFERVIPANARASKYSALRDGKPIDRWRFATSREVARRDANVTASAK
jgi:hypothetical protein